MISLSSSVNGSYANIRNEKYDNVQSVTLSCLMLYSFRMPGYAEVGILAVDGSDIPNIVFSSG